MTDILHWLWLARRSLQARMARPEANVEALAELLYALDCFADRRWRARVRGEK